MIAEEGFWDSERFHAKNFQFENNKAVKKGGQWYRFQVLSRQTLQPNHTYAFQIHYGGKNKIIVGLVTQARAQEKESGDEGHEGSVGYSSVSEEGEGSIFVDGVKAVQGHSDLLVEEEGIVEMVFNAEAKTLNFTNKRKGKSWQVKVPQSYCCGGVYVFACMKDKGSWVQLV